MSVVSGQRPPVTREAHAPERPRRTSESEQGHNRQAHRERREAERVARPVVPARSLDSLGCEVVGDLRCVSAGRGGRVRGSTGQEQAAEQHRAEHDAFGLRETPFHGAQMLAAGCKTAQATIASEPNAAIGSNKDKTGCLTFSFG